MCAFGAQASHLCRQPGAMIHGEQSSINTEEEKLHWKQSLFLPPVELCGQASGSR